MGFCVSRRKGYLLNSNLLVLSQKGRGMGQVGGYS